MYFIDTNIFMYAAGTEHSNKIPSINLLHRIAAKEIDACINVEVLQEILHRYRHINRWEDGKVVYTLTRKIIPVILPLDALTMETCYHFMEKYPTVMARDALHAAFCKLSGITSVYSFDKDFDIFEEFIRQEPGENHSPPSDRP